MKANDIEMLTLSNGVRIVTEKVPGVKSVALGIWVGSGSRMEMPGEEGISHFIEHLLFKGTKKRSARDIAEALDDVGGQLNAFTAKEMTCYYAKVMEEHLPLAVDVLSDMFFNASFEIESMEKERSVIKEEIAMYEDSPSDYIHDFFIETAWPDVPLGKGILGTGSSLDEIDSSKVKAYIGRQYVPEKVVIAVAGALNHHKTQRLLQPIFEAMESRPTIALVPAPQDLSGLTRHLTRETGQVQICLGTQGLNLDDERMYALYLMNNILGGGLSSRLVQTIREDRGWAYSVYSYNSAFRDAGLFAFYAGTAPATAEPVVDMFYQTMRDLKKDGVTEKEFERARQQARGSLFMGMESITGRMNRLGRNLLLLDRVIPPEETMDKIFAVQKKEIQELARDLFEGRPQVLATIGPNEVKGLQ